MIPLEFSLILGLGTVFFGGISRGYTGFGAALIIVPILMLTHGPVVAVIIMSLIEVPGALQLARTAIREADWPALAPLCIAAAITIPIGAWSLASLNTEIIHKAIGALVVIFGALIASGWHYQGETKKTLSTIAGALSGFCSGIASLGGPPVVMFLIAKGSGATQTRAGIAAYFAIATALRIAAFGWYELYSKDTVVLSLFLAPFYMAGIWIGSRFFEKTTELLFRRVVVLLVLIMGGIALLK